MSRGLATVVASLGLAGVMLALVNTWAAMLVGDAVLRDRSVPAPALVSLDATRWTHRYRQLVAASKLQAGRADLSLELGNLHTWQALHQTPHSAGSVQHWRAAELFYVRAVRSRPTWGLAWIQLAEVRLALYGAGRRFEDAFERAQSLAPWEQDVHAKSLLLVISSWDSLSADTQARSRRLAQRALATRQGRGLLERMLNRFADDRIRAAFLGDTTKG